MTQQMPLSVLRTRVAQMRAKAEEGGRGFAFCPAFYRKASEQREPASIEDVPQDLLKSQTEPRQRKVLTPDGGNRRPALHRPPGRALNLVDLGCGELFEPI